MEPDPVTRGRTQQQLQTLNMPPADESLTAMYLTATIREIPTEFTVNRARLSEWVQDQSHRLQYEGYDHAAGFPTHTHVVRSGMDRINGRHLVRLEQAANESLVGFLAEIEIDDDVVTTHGRGGLQMPIHRYRREPIWTDRLYDGDSLVATYVFRPQPGWMPFRRWLVNREITLPGPVRRLQLNSAVEFHSTLNIQPVQTQLNETSRFGTHNMTNSPTFINSGTLRSLMGDRFSIARELVAPLPGAAAYSEQGYYREVDQRWSIGSKLTYDAFLMDTYTFQAGNAAHRRIYVDVEWIKLAAAKLN
ncbi:MAG: hypothetical protein AAF958_17620 [Planctomycetota bacterium]